MKIFVHDILGTPLQVVFKQVLDRLLPPEDFSLTDSMTKADVILLRDTGMLETIHTHHQHFLFLRGREQLPPTAANVTVLPSITTAIVEILKTLFEQLKIRQTAPVTTAASGPSVLVIDDSPRHAAFAQKQLAATCRLTVVSTYAQALNALQKGKWDVVMTDLMLPASEQTLGTEAITEHAGKEMPLGFVLALLAARADVKKIAVVTDMNHHNHPLSAAFDHLRGMFIVENAVIIFSNYHVTAEGKNWQAVLDALNAP